MSAWTGSYASIDGLILDGVDEFGVKWGISEIDGWGSTSPTLEVVQKARGGGGWSGDSYGGPRTVAISGWLKAPTELLAADAADRLIAAVGRDERILSMVEDGRARWVAARRSGRVLVTKRRPGYSTWSIQVSADDWRKFGAALQGSTGLPASSGGLTVPFTVPFTIASTLTAGRVVLENTGKEVGPVSIRIDGPATGPIVTHIGSGLSLVFASSLVMAAGDWLDIDMEKHSVMLNGQASRQGYVTSRGWSQFEPGVNQWGFSASSFTSGALMTVTATPADE